MTVYKLYAIGALEVMNPLDIEGEKPNITVDETALTVDNAAQELIIPVYTNINFTLDIPSSCNWVTSIGGTDFDSTTTMIVLNVDENQGDERYVTIKLKADEIYGIQDIEITITQEA